MIDLLIEFFINLFWDLEFRESFLNHCVEESLDAPSIGVMEGEHENENRASYAFVSFATE